MSLFSRLIRWYYSFAPGDPVKTSRGHLILDWLQTTSKEDQLAFKEQIEKRQKDYYGFNLVFGNSEGLYHFMHKSDQESDNMVQKLE